MKKQTKNLQFRTNDRNKSCYNCKHAKTNPEAYGYYYCAAEIANGVAIYKTCKLFAINTK